jgi:hypothetical protein
VKLNDDAWESAESLAEHLPAVVENPQEMSFADLVAGLCGSPIPAGQMRDAALLLATDLPGELYRETHFLLTIAAELKDQMRARRDGGHSGLDPPSLPEAGP